MYGPDYGPAYGSDYGSDYGPDPRLNYHARGHHLRREPAREQERPRTPRKLALIAAALAAVVAMVVVVGLLAAAGGLAGGAAEEADDQGDLQAFVNGAAPQERGAKDATGGDAPKDEPASQGETAQVRLVGPSRATAGRPFRVVAAFRDLPDGAGLRAYVQAMRPDGRVGATKAVASCRLDEPGEQDTLTGSCPAVAAGSYRLAVVVERAPRRAGDFPPVDVGRLVVTSGTSGTDSATAAGGGGGPAPAPDDVRGVEQRMVELTNQARRAAGVAPLSVDASLTEASRDWACAMAADKELRHDPNFADSGAQGENVAFRTDPGDDVALLLHEQFMNSPGHRDNILNPRWREIGIGFCAENGFWVTERFAP